MWMDGEMLLQKLFQCNELVGFILVKQLKWLTWSCSVKVFEDKWKCLMLRKVIPKNLLGVILPTEPIRQMGVCEVCHNLKHDWNVDDPERWSSLWTAISTLPCFSNGNTYPPSKWSFLQLKEKTGFHVEFSGGGVSFIPWKGAVHISSMALCHMAHCFQVTFLRFQLRCSAQALPGTSVWAPLVLAAVGHPNFPSFQEQCWNCPVPRCADLLPDLAVRSLSFPSVWAGEIWELCLCVGRRGAGVRGHQRCGVLLLHGREHGRGQRIRHRPAARQPLPRRLLTKVSLWSLLREGFSQLWTLLLI